MPVFHVFRKMKQKGFKKGEKYPFLIPRKMPGLNIGNIKRVY